MDKTTILQPPKRPIAGGTAHGSRPRRYDYWRTGYGAQQPQGVEFWVAQVGEYHCKPGYVTGDFEHGHRTQGFYHLEGDATFATLEHNVTVQIGDLLLTPPGYGFRYSTRQGMKHYWFALDGAWPKALGEPRVIVSSLGFDAEIDRLLVEMRENLILRRPGYALRAVGVFYEWLARWEELDGSATQAEPVYPDVMRNALTYLRENYATAFNAAETAAAVGVSESHLRALFEKWLGESPKRFHTRYRIDQARRLLSEQDLSISEVAFHVGFADAAHFSRVFKQITGVTPSLYRQGPKGFRLNARAAGSGSGEASFHPTPR